MVSKRFKHFIKFLVFMLLCWFALIVCIMACVGEPDDKRNKKV